MSDGISPPASSAYYCGPLVPSNVVDADADVTSKLKPIPRTYFFPTRHIVPSTQNTYTARLGGLGDDVETVLRSRTSSGECPLHESGFRMIDLALTLVAECAHSLVLMGYELGAGSSGSQPWPNST